MASGALSKKDEFRNTSTGWLGVVTIDGRGDHTGTPVAPGDSVWLSEEEQIATANAPRSEDDNPFLPRSQPIFNEDGDEVDRVVQPLLELRSRGAEVRNRRPYGAVAQEPVVEDETGEELELAPVGTRPDDEEVGTPAARRRRRG
jgi:hypothetical protein